MTPEPDEFRRRAIRAALTVVGIAVALGLLVGGLTAGAVYMSGVIPEPAPTPALPEEDNDDELPSPSLSPTETPSPTRTPSTPASASPSAQQTPTEKPTPTKPTPTRSRKPKPDTAIQLRASASSVSSYEQVTLSGSYPGGDGTTLEVQRREGGSWAAFPTSATVDGGAFSTYVESGQPGPNAFRVLDPSTGQTSNVVVFTVS